MYFSSIHTFSVPNFNKIGLTVKINEQIGIVTFTCNAFTQVSAAGACEKAFIVLVLINYPPLDFDVISGIPLSSIAS